MLIEEIMCTESQISTSGHHRIMVENHKTGSIQSAIVFLDNCVFRGLLLFVKSVLPLLPCYRDASTIDGKDVVFQTYSGCPVTSSQVTTHLKRGFWILALYIGVQLQIFNVPQPH